MDGIRAGGAVEINRSEMRGVILKHMLVHYERILRGGIKSVAKTLESSKKSP